MSRIFRNNIKKIKLFLLKTTVKTADLLNKTKNYISDPPHRCLIISTTGIGDTIWGTPGIRALKGNIPFLSLSVLTNTNGAEILKENPHIDRIFVFKKGVVNIFSLLKELRQNCFDTVVVFHASDRIVWLIAYLTGAGKVIGSKRNSKETDFLITHPVTIPIDASAIYERHLFIRDLGVKSFEKKTELFITDTERKRTEHFLKERGINRYSLLVGFQPGAAKPYKRWPEENFIKLGRMISGIRDNIQIIITGNTEEKELTGKIANETGGVSIAGKLSLRETAAVIEKCDLFIANDTGPMHIAVALGTPAIALISATGEDHIKPYRDISSFMFVLKPRPCKDCMAKACTRPLCMEQISPEEVFEIVEKQLTLSRAKLQMLKKYE